MLISGGKVVAIDEVLHDQTLTGDGRFNKLGVNSGYFLTKAAADEYYQPKGDYALKRDLNGYYTKNEADTRFAQLSTVYTRDVLDRKFQDIANTYATKNELNAVSLDLSNFKLTVERTYLTKDDAAATYATKIELANQYTTITNETDEKIGKVNNTLEQLVVYFDEHAANTAIHFVDDEKEKFNTLTAIDFSQFVNTSGLADLPKNKQYAIFNGDYGWSWVETQGGGGVANITGVSGIYALNKGDYVEVGLDDASYRAVQEAKKLETAYQLIGGRAISVYDVDEDSVTKIETELPEIVFTGTELPEEKPDFTVYLQTMTADLL
jgi:hypothetical protein